MKTNELPPVSIRQIERAPEGVAPSELARIAVTYANVFAGPPWSEVSKCMDGFSPEPAGSQCEDCGEERGEAYPLFEQVNIIGDELSRPDAACFVVEDQTDGELVGFSWGFQYRNVDEFLEQKYSGDGEAYDRLRGDVRAALAEKAIRDQDFYYLSETGIIADDRYRGRGLSKQLTTMRAAVAQERGLDMVQRTSNASMMYRTMKSAGFTEVLGANVGTLDAVNPQRSLFVKKYAKATS